MKRLFLALGLGTAALVAPFSVSSLHAETESSAPADSPAHPRLEQIAAELELSDAQKEKIAPILKQEVADFQALKADTSLRKMQRLRKARDISNNASKQIRAELNPDQQKKYDAMREEWKKEMKARVKERKAQSGA